MRLAAALAAACLLSVAGIAAAESGTVTLSSFERQVVLTLDLRAGDAIEYSWSSFGSSVEFEVVHDRTTVFTRTGQVGQGTLTANADGLYEFRFRNTAFGATSVSWTINRSSPFPWVVAGLVLVIVAIIALGIWQRMRRGRPGMPPQYPLPPR